MATASESVPLSVVDAAGMPPIPPMQLQQVDNETSFAHAFFDKMGKGKLFYDVVVYKATFTLASGKLVAAPVQQRIEFADRCWDEETAEASSLRVAGDALLYKPSTDVLVSGTARSADGRPRRGWPAAVGVSRNGVAIAHHKMQLLGPRWWRHRWIGGWQLSRPEETDAIALRHENAYGGRYAVRQVGDSVEWATCETNPAGRGYWDARQLDREISHPAAQIELLNRPFKRMHAADAPLASPAPVARFWADRTRYAGTYDDAWRRQCEASLIVDYPADFDSRFFQCAHPNLIMPKHLQGDERFHLVGLTRTASIEHPLIFDLPGLGVQASLHAASGHTSESAMLLDTVHIDLDAATVALTWRLTLDQRACVESVSLRKVTVGVAA